MSNRIKPEFFQTSDWIDKGTYWLNVHPQCSPQWHGTKEKLNLVTASNFGAVIGHSKFKTVDEMAEFISGYKKQDFSEKSLQVMGHGVEVEPWARDWYIQTYKVDVREVGLAIPKWYPKIGCSLDGEVIGPNGELDGMIEIKSPYHMYQPLIEHSARIQAGWKPPPFYHDHIWKTHYAQMQGCMAIMNKKWCHYVVFSTDDKEVFQEILYFNKDYWENILFPGLRDFIENKLEPLIEQIPTLRLRDEQMKDEIERKKKEEELAKQLELKREEDKKKTASSWLQNLIAKRNDHVADNKKLSTELQENSHQNINDTTDHNQINHQNINNKEINFIQINYEELHNQLINNQQSNNEGINNEEITNKQSNNQQSNNEEINNEEINNEEINYEEINNQLINNQQLNNEGINNDEKKKVSSWLQNILTKQNDCVAKNKKSNMTLPSISEKKENKSDLHFFSYPEQLRKTEDIKVINITSSKSRPIEDNRVAEKNVSSIWLQNIIAKQNAKK